MKFELDLVLLCTAVQLYSVQTACHQPRQLIGPAEATSVAKDPRSQLTHGMVQRVFVTHAPTSAASCKRCGVKFDKGDRKVALCEPSPWHAGLDNSFHHLHCCLEPVISFSKRNSNSPPEFYHKLKAEDLLALHAQLPCMFPVLTQMGAQLLKERRLLDDELWRVKQTIAVSVFGPLPFMYAGTISQ